MTSLIYSYTRAQAIADGVLVDASAMAKEAGLRFPVALTSAVWQGCVLVPEELTGEQDEEGRLWDILWMLLNAIRTGKDGTVLRFQLHVKSRENRRPQLVTLKAVCGPGDGLEPVITVMYPAED